MFLYVIIVLWMKANVEPSTIQSLESEEGERARGDRRD